MTQETMNLTPEQSRRRARMAVLAKAAPERLHELLPELPAHRMIRGPEIGSMMVQGRTGGTGAPFHLGEMTVTRATVALECGTLGHALVQGRDTKAALRAALIDAMAETAAGASQTAALLELLSREAESRRTARAGRAEATRVEFFTLQRGDG